MYTQGAATLKGVWKLYFLRFKFLYDKKITVGKSLKKFSVQVLLQRNDLKEEFWWITCKLRFEQTINKKRKFSF